MHWSTRLVGLSVGLLIAASLTVWATRKAWGVGMIVGTSEPTYSPTAPPADVETVLEVECAGATVRAWVVSPEGAPRATLFLLHGIHDSKASLLPSARRHAMHGFRVVVVDSRGHGESSGRWLSYGVHESSDLTALVDRMEDRGLLVRPLGVVGTSYGAATAVQHAARDGRVTTTAAIASFASMREVVPAYVAWMTGPASGLIPSVLLTDLLNEAGRQASFDPDQACPRCVAEGIQGSLLLIHSRDDERIPWRHSVAIRDAATSASEVKLMLVSGVDHLGTGSAPGVPEAVDVWLAEHLLDHAHR